MLNCVSIPGWLGSIILILHRSHRPLGVGDLRALHGVPEDAIEQVFGAGVNLVQRQARRGVGSLRNKGS